MGGDEHLEVQSARCGDTVRLSKKKGNYKLTIDRGQKCFQYEDKRCAKVKSSTRQYILLAHGMNDQKRVWDHFADRIAKKYPKITVLRTSVSRCGSILERAEQLADYINKTSKELGIADGAIKAVGHSMGGIDLRYIVGNAQKNKRFKQAARKFKRIYTIGTPHHGARGSEISTLWKGCAEVSLDLSESAMAAFNKKYPYRDFKVDGRRIPFLAFNFVCDSWGGNAIPIGDCVVSANSRYSGDRHRSTAADPSMDVIRWVMVPGNARRSSTTTRFLIPLSLILSAGELADQQKRIAAGMVFRTKAVF